MLSVGEPSVIVTSTPLSRGSLKCKLEPTASMQLPDPSSEEKPCQRYSAEDTRADDTSVTDELLWASTEAGEGSNFSSRYVADNDLKSLDMR